jgi:hypothetical protein
MYPKSSRDSVEFDLLCQAVRPAPDLAAIDEAIGDLSEQIRLVALAADHGVRPALLRCLNALGWQGVTAEVRAALESFGRQHLIASLAAAEELGRIADALDAAGVPFASFKGPTLAVALHDDLAAREFNDIDLLVPADEVQRAEAVLARLGYAGELGRDATFRRAFLAWQGQYRLRLAGHATAVDLHWLFGGTHVPFPLATDTVWGRRAGIAVGRRAIPGFATADLALLLAGHGTKERWDRLKWVADFAWFADRHPDFDWSALYRQAHARRSGISVLLAIAIAHDLLQMPVPPAIATTLAEAHRAQALAETLAAALRCGANFEERRHLSDLVLCDRTIDKARAIARLAATPTIGDYEALPLPRGAWPVYRLTRPLRLAAGATASLLRRLREIH